jgi:hypothetical protein
MLSPIAFPEAGEEAPGPAVRGDMVMNVTKLATLETGAVAITTAAIRRAVPCATDVGVDPRDHGTRLDPARVLLDEDGSRLRTQLLGA